MSEQHEDDRHAQGLGHVMTDLAMEAHQVLVQERGGPEIPGVRVQTEQHPEAVITRVVIETEGGAQAMGKMQGTYVTIEAPSLRDRNKEHQTRVSELAAQEIEALLEVMQVGPEAPCLVVGLGNRNATPDALGPQTVDQLLVTRHLHGMVPPELQGGLRPVAAIAPGVLGLTGIETGEIIAGIVDRIKPAAVICIDALAARSAQRLGTTLQIADTGINPGAGVGNRRMGINRQTLGVPVLAIGVPTVIYATTIVGDALDLLAQELGGGPSRGVAAGVESAVDGRGLLDPGRIQVRRGGSGPNGTASVPPPVAAPVTAAEVPRGQDALGLPIDPVQKNFMVEQLLGPHMGGMVVTPKEIDTLIGDIAACIGGALNVALHPALELDDILAYLGG